MAIYLFIGPSGSGKTTLSRVCEEYGIPELVSTTTREKREGEIDGVNYHFISEEAFMTIDFAEKSTYAGNHYGITVKEIEEKLSDGGSAYAVVDATGMKKVREMFDDCISIFIDVSPELMVQRMKDRGDSDYNIAKRLAHCLDNNEFDNAKFCDYVIENNHLDTAQNDLRKIIEEMGGERKNHQKKRA